MSNLVGLPLDPYVQRQIKLRQQILGNNRVIEDNIGYNVALNNNKNAWVRLASSVNVNPTSTPFGENFAGSKLAENFLLIGGVTSMYNLSGGFQGGISTTSDLKESSQFPYGLGSVANYGFTPIPGLENAKIRHLNRGAIRKFDIKLKANDKDQFELLESLYLKLGYYMLLEWGHTSYTISNQGSPTFVEKAEFSSLPLSKFFTPGFIDSDIETAIDTERRKREGNYDAALFKINNYSWNFNPGESSYEITINGISKGGLIDSLTIGSPKIFDDKPTFLQDYTIINPDAETKKLILEELGATFSSDDDILKIYKSTIVSKLANGEYNLLQSAGAIKTINPSSLTSPTSLDLKSAFEAEDDNNVITILDQNKSLLNKILFSYHLALKQTDWKQIDEKDRYKQTTIRENLLGSIDLSNLKEAVSIKFDNPQKEENASEYNYITLGTLMTIIKDNVLSTQETLKLKISSEYEDNLIFTHWFQHSTDPRVCLIPFQNNEVKEGGKTLLSNILGEGFRVKDEPYQGRLMAIHVNIEYITSTLASSKNEEGEINLYSFLEKLMYGIQDALGSINNFIISYDEINGLNIKDDTVIPGVVDEEQPHTPLRLYGIRPGIEGSFVRNISTQSQISGKLATQIAIGSTASGTDPNPSTAVLSRWNEGYVDRLQLEERKRLPSTIQDPSQISELRQEINSKNKKQFKFIEESYENFKYLGDSTYGTAATNLKSLIEYDLGVKTINGNIAGKGIIPIDLTLETDGLSGIILFQKLVVTDEILPSSYINKIDFIIQALDHTIDNTWTTTINTLSVPRKQDLSRNQDSADFSIIDTQKLEEALKNS